MGVNPGTPVSSTNKTDCNDITEILLKVTLNTIKQTNKNKRTFKWSLFVLRDGGLRIQAIYLVIQYDGLEIRLSIK
jgi:hypothetical protein